MLKLNNISLRFAARTIIDGVSLVVNDGERAAVIGPNGAGKTTLLRVIAGELVPDRGGVQHGRRAPGYLRQGIVAKAGAHVGDVFPHAGSSALRRAQSALRLRAIEPDEQIDALSGGELTKLGLLELVASDPGALLLDEPTNHLDLPALAWLDEYIAAFRGPVVFVSHDRALLEAHATQILALDAPDGRAEVYSGGYEEYCAVVARRAEERWTAFRRQEQRERDMEREIRAIKQSASTRERISQNDFYRRKNKKLARRAVVMERRLRREQASEERIEKPQRRQYRVKAELQPATRAGDRMVHARIATVRAGPHELLRDVDLLVGWGERVVLTGENGSGKTTLLRAIAGDSPQHDEVALSPGTRIGYLAQADHGPADDGAAEDDGTPLGVIRRTSALSETEARRFLHRFLFAGDDALRGVRELSYGERRRLALAKLVLAGANLLLLDEPTNHLDIPSREAFESALDGFDGSMLAVTHDRRFIERFGTRLLTIEDGRLRELWR